jgi:hypothetical protein
MHFISPRQEGISLYTAQAATYCLWIVIFISITRKKSTVNLFYFT